MIPAAFARGTLEREGESAKLWLAELPAIVEGLLSRWECSVDGAVTHGRVGVIVPVRCAAGSAVIKVSFPHPGNLHEPDALAAWGGGGAVLLHEREDELFAMLLERVHPATLADAADAARVAGQLSRRLAIPAPAGLPRLQDRADEWDEQLRKDAFELEHRLPASALDAALAVIDELGRDQPDTVIHGDLHPNNILRADREPWLAVDPKGWVGDPAYDGATFLRPRALALIESDDLVKALHHELEVFAEAAELDPARLRLWAHLRAVQDAFHGRRHGFGVARQGPLLDRLIAVVDHLAVSWR
ncbi:MULTISPECIES: aminoglycoside phosphotransferase family protein [unclassified Kribbella]|uniref:aminoglycoside phosphotransferase family protein n=1 Tax=unclassified Kribbella TaxID=2644121 RepID=UPI003016DA71